MVKDNNFFKNMKTYFLILNMIISIIAFSFILSSGIEIIDAQTCTTGNCGAGTKTTTPPAKTNPPVPPATPGSTPTPTSVSPPNGLVMITPGVTGLTDAGNGGLTEKDQEDVYNDLMETDVTSTSSGDIFGSLGGINWQSMIYKGGVGAGIFGTIGSLAGGDNGALWGSIAGAVGGAVAGLTQEWLGETWSTILGLGIAALIFILTYAKKSQETVEFNCLPWQAPIGGKDCQTCNTFKECSLYSCKSLGQACDIINSGTPEQKCIWKNPGDVNSPKIEFKEIKNKGHKFKPNPSTRPPATGVIVVPDKGSCIKAFTPLEFIFETDEPAQCKIDYNLTRGYDEMNFFVGGDSLFLYNHSESLSLPGPDAINAVSPELKNDGTYTLYVRCKDANGNFNQDAYTVNFCVEKGPDTTPPVITGVSIPSEKPVQFNQTKLYLEVYVNEPSECKWSREDRSYENMENKMDCMTNLWDMNWNGVYTCKTNLTGMESRKENKYYFKCKDQPNANEGDRNVNVESYLYKVIGTQPLNIMAISPRGTIAGATDTIPVFLEISTDNGYKNGEALCYYHQFSPEKDEDYILFLETGTSEHKQRQDLVSGDYTYYFKCIDLGGNTVYNTTLFKVMSDKTGPSIVRVYKENSELKIMSDEEAECSYSNSDCNFEIESGIKMISVNKMSHNSEWKVNQNYYIRCRDNYNNQPNPNVCSIVVRPSKTDTKSDVIEI
jgi:hypothetical protein